MCSRRWEAWKPVKAPKTSTNCISALHRQVDISQRDNPYLKSISRYAPRTRHRCISFPPPAIDTRCTSIPRDIFPSTARLSRPSTGIITMNKPERVSRFRICTCVLDAASINNDQFQNGLNDWISPFDAVWAQWDVAMHPIAFGTSEDTC